MSKPQSFIHGTLTLVITGLIVRLLGFFIRLIMVRAVGEEAIGLYHLVLPTFFFIFTFTQCGLPVAISQRVSKYYSKHDTKTIRRLFYYSLTIALTLSVATSLLLFVVKDTMLLPLFSDQRVKHALVPLLWLIPLATCSSVLKGFFQGLHNMRPQGISQLLEQIVRLFLLLYGLKDYPFDTVDILAEKLLWQSVISECFSLIYLFILYLNVRLPKKHLLNRPQHLTKELLSIALPTTGMRMIHSFGHFLEPLIIHRQFILNGLSITGATKAYGLLTGYIFPLVNFPMFITQAIAQATIPSVTEAIEQKNIKQTHDRIHQAVRYSIMVGIFFTILLMVYPDTLLFLMYDTNQGIALIKWLAFFYFFTYLHFPFHAILQASDETHRAMFNSIINFIVKITALTYFMRWFDPMVGVIVSLSLLSMISTLLHYNSVKKATGYQLTFTFLNQIIGLFIVFLGVTATCRYLLKLINASVWLELSSIPCLFIVFILLSIGFRILPLNEWRMLSQRKSTRH